MSKIKLLTLAVVGLLVMNLCIVGFLFFRNPPHLQGGPPPFEEGGPKRRIIEMLHFDEGQVREYEKLIDQHMVSIKELNEQIRDTKSNLYQTLHAEKGDSNKKDSLFNQLGALQKEIETIHYAHFMEIKKLCKPDQSEYFNTLINYLADFFNTGKDGRRPPNK